MLLVCVTLCECSVPLVIVSTRVVLSGAPRLGNENSGLRVSPGSAQWVILMHF